MQLALGRDASKTLGLSAFEGSFSSFDPSSLGFAFSNISLDQSMAFFRSATTSFQDMIRQWFERLRALFVDNQGTGNHFSESQGRQAPEVKTTTEADLYANEFRVQVEEQIDTFISLVAEINPQLASQMMALRTELAREINHLLTVLIGLRNEFLALFLLIFCFLLLLRIYILRSRNNPVR